MFVSFVQRVPFPQVLQLLVHRVLLVLTHLLARLHVQLVLLERIPIQALVRVYLVLLVPTRVV